MIEVKKFYAVWCGPCKALTPIIENIKPKFSNVKFEEIDDGFLIFHNRKGDFELSLLDMIQPDDLIAFLKSKDLWNTTNESILSKIVQILNVA